MRTKLLLLLLVFLTFWGCAGSSQSFIEPEMNLNAFQYVYIPPLKYNDGSFDKFGLRIKLMELVSNKGLIVLDESELKSLPSKKMVSVLLTKLSHKSGRSSGLMSNGSQIVTLEFYDYKNMKIYGGIGDFGYGSDEIGDLYGALENAFSGFSANYSGFNPTLVKDINQEANNNYGDWEKINYDEDSFKDWIRNNSNRLTPIEGIWTSLDDNEYRVGIVRDSLNINRDYVAFIIRSGNSKWLPQHVKIEFNSTAYQTIFNTTYYMSDHSKQVTTSRLNDDGLLEFKVKAPNGSAIKLTFIKNYPTINQEKSIGRFEEDDRNSSSGSGIIISKNGLIATNWHVISDRRQIKIILPQINKTFSGTVILKDVSNDIAILRIDNFSYSKYFRNEIPFKIISSRYTKQAQKVFTLGFPLGDVLGKKARLSDGIINSLFGIKDDPRLMQISNPIQPGNSGGPLFNSSGEVIGLVVSSLNAKLFYEMADIIPQNVNFAIKSDYLLNLISLLPEDSEIKMRENKLADKSFEKQVDALIPFIVNIVAN